MPRQMHRRSFLRLWALAAAAPMVLTACPAAKPDPVEPPSTCADPVDDGGEAWDVNPEAWAVDRQRFPLAPQSGAMRADSALIWGACSEGLEVQFHLWREKEGERFLVRSGSQASEAGRCRLTMDGLAPGTWYRFVWFVEDEAGTPQRSIIGQFRTALAPGCGAPIRVVATSCTNWRAQPWTALEGMAEEEADIFLQLGDMAYNDGARSAEDYRSRWERCLSDPGYEALLPSRGMYITWDDHEIVDSGTYYTISEERRRIATEAWFENLATPRLEGDRFWDSYRWGDTAEFFVLDSRSERIPETRHDADATYISRAQMDWLKGALVASQARWKVLLSSVAMTNWPPAMIMEVDRWEGYAAQRQELLDHIAGAGVEGVIVIGGDFHCGSVSRLEPEGPSAKIFEVLVGPGGNGGNPMGTIWEQGTQADRDRTFGVGQFYFVSPYISTTSFVFEPDRVEVRFGDHETRELRYAAAIKPDGTIAMI